MTKRISIVLSFVFSLLLLTITVRAASLADPGDIFYVTSPAPNAVVSGTVNYSFRIFDDEQASVAYQVVLANAANCNNQIGTIASGNATSNSSSDFSISWKTGGPIVDVASITDGTYCLKTCVSLLDAGSPYTACSLRLATVRNHNSAPHITSTVASIVNLKTTDAWQYDVNATDSDGDTVAYRLATTPSFLSINSGTGLVFTNSQTRSVGTHNVTVMAEDSYGGRDTQTFQIVISEAATSSTSSTSTSSSTSTVTTSSASSSTDVLNPALSVMISAPKSNTVFSGAENEISWEATGEGLDQIRIYYSQDGIVWRQVAEMEASESQYTWDVSDIDDGNYLLQLELTDDSGNIVSNVSERFVIANEQTGGELTTEPLITNILPSADSETRELKPEIKGRFIPSNGNTIDTSTFSFFLDSVDRVELCEVDSEGFVCTPDTDLALGAHEVRASIKDSSDLEANQVWSFSIVVEETEDTADDAAVFMLFGNPISTHTLLLLAVIMCAGGLLIIIPWLLYAMWKKKKEQEVKVSVDTKTEVVDTPRPINPADFSSYDEYMAALSGKKDGVKQTTETKAEVVPEIVEPVAVKNEVSMPVVEKKEEQVMNDVAPIVQVEEKSVAVDSNPVEATVVPSAMPDVNVKVETTVVPDESTFEVPEVYMEPEVIPEVAQIPATSSVIIDEPVGSASAPEVVSPVPSVTASATVSPSLAAEVPATTVSEVKTEVSNSDPLPTPAAPAEEILSSGDEPAWLEPPLNTGKDPLPVAKTESATEIGYAKKEDN